MQNSKAGAIFHLELHRPLAVALVLMTLFGACPERGVLRYTAIALSTMRQGTQGRLLLTHSLILFPMLSMTYYGLAIAGCLEFATLSHRQKSSWTHPCPFLVSFHEHIVDSRNV